MTRYIVAGAVCFGLLAAVTTLADEEFEDDHVGVEESEANLEELAQDYSAILEELQQRGAATSSAEEQKRKSSTALELQVRELPFEVLGRELDSDGDGLSDSDEERLNTNPSSSDTDGDSYIDGLEVVRGYNPLVASPNDKVSLVELDVSGFLPTSQMLITGVRLDRMGGNESLLITGSGLANSLLTVVVYSSDPLVMFVRTDDTGRFQANLDDVLEEGAHQAYVALLDVRGKVAQVSAPFAFLRTAEGIELPEITASASTVDAGETAGIVRGLIALGSAIGAMVLLGVVVWFIAWRRARHRKSIPALEGLGDLDLPE